MAGENVLEIRLSGDGGQGAAGGKPPPPSGGSFPAPSGGQPPSLLGQLSPFMQGIQQLGGSQSPLMGVLGKVQQIGQFIGAGKGMGGPMGGSVGNAIPVASGKPIPAGQGAELAEVTAAEGAGAGGGAMAAAGPIGLAIGAALLIVQKIEEGIDKAFDKLGRSIERLGEAGSSAASGNNARALGGLAHGAAEGMQSIAKEAGPLGHVFAGLIGTGVKMGDAFVDVTNSFVERGKQIAPFNANLMGANVQADIRSLMGDIREAQVLGNDLARMTDAQSKLENDLREMLLPIKAFVVEKLADALDWLEGALTDIDARVELTAHAVEKIAFIASVLGGAIPASLMQQIEGSIKELAEHARKARQEREREEMKNAPLDKFLHELREIERKFAGNHRHPPAPHDHGAQFPIIRQANPWNVPGFTPPWLQPRPAPGN